MSEPEFERVEEDEDEEFPSQLYVYAEDAEDDEGNPLLIPCREIDDTAVLSDERIVAVYELKQIVRVKATVQVFSED